MVKAGDLFINITTKGADKAKAQIQSLGGAVKNFSLLTKTAFIAAVVVVATFIKTLTALKAQIDFTTVSFEKMTTQSKRLLKELRTATQGMVSNLELMQSANQALLLGIEENQLEELFKNAAVVAKASGRTTTQAIEDITTGIGRQSRLILDNLGIIVRADEAQRKYATTLGKSASALTEQEKRLAFTAAAMESLREKAEELGVEVEALIDPTQRLDSSWQNLKETFAESADVIGGPVANSLAKLFDRMGFTAKTTKELSKAQRELFVEFLKGNITFKERANVLAFMEKAQKDGIVITDALTESMERQTIAAEENITVLDAGVKAGREQKETFKERQSALRLDIELLNADTEAERESIRIKQSFLEQQKNIIIAEREGLINKIQEVKLLILLGEKTKILTDELSNLNSQRERELRLTEGRGNIDFGSVARATGLASFERDAGIRGAATAKRIAGETARFEANRARRNENRDFE